MSLTRRELFELTGLTIVAGGMARVRADETLDATARRAADVVRGYSAEGFHRTATAVDRASADRLVSLARAAGARPRLQPFELSRVDPAASFVEIDGRRFEGLPMFDGSFTAPEGVRGAIGAVNGDRAIAWTRINPNGEVELRKSRDGSPHRALIAVTTGQHPGLCPVNAASFTEPFGPPVLQISSEHQPAIERAAAAGVEVRVVAAASRHQATAFNVAAEVTGRTELPPVCVMTPRSGWYYNASERGGGLVCWLETLRACAAAKPLRSVRLVASSGHELGHLGLHAYLAANPALAREALVWMHYGANIGASTGEVGMVCSGDRLESVSLRALAAYGLAPAGYGPDGVRRASAPRVAGEAATIAREGGRFVSLIGQNAWFHNPRDVWPDAVDIQKVARFARATADLTLSLANMAG